MDPYPNPNPNPKPNPKQAEQGEGLALRIACPDVCEPKVADSEGP